jgi:hypothetical protein
VSGNSEILDTKILQVSRDLADIAFSPQVGGLDKAAVTFGILEPDDGAALQVTYAGPRDAELNFSGVTIGASHPTIKSPNLPFRGIARELVHRFHETNLLWGIPITLPHVVRWHDLNMMVGHHGSISARDRYLH